MDNDKNMEKGVVTRSKSQNGKQKREISVSKLGRNNPSPGVKVETTAVSSDSSGSADEDYIEFLRTYDPRKSSPDVQSSGEEEGSQVTVETKEKPRKKPRKASGKIP
jgi:hypothetical protein